MRVFSIGRVSLVASLLSVANVFLDAKATYGQAAAAADIGMELAKDVLKDLGERVKGNVSARTDALAKSSGPDADDLGLRPNADEFDGWWGLEWELKAEVFGDLGPNAGDAHFGAAEMVVVWKDGAWVIDQIDTDEGKAPARDAVALARKDTTPVRGSNNATAAAAIATFSINGAIQEDWTIKNAHQNGVRAGGPTSSGSGLGDIRLEPTSGIDVKSVSTAAYVWSLSEFQLQDMDVEGQIMTQVMPPQSQAVIGHQFLQLAGSPNYRRRYIDSAGASPLLDGSADDLDFLGDADHGTLAFGPGDTADFTVSGGMVSMPILVVPRNGRSNRDVVEQYLQSLVVLPPDHAQTGYIPDVTVFAPLGGANDFPAGSELGLEGGFGDFSVDLSPYDWSSLVGFVAQIEGNLTTAANLALNTPGHPIIPLLDGAQVDDTVLMDMTYSSSEEVEAYASNSITLEEPALIWNGGPGVWQDMNWQFGGGPPTPLQNAVLLTANSLVSVLVPAAANSTAVVQGELRVLQPATLTSKVFVNALGTVSGNGSINGEVYSEGTFKPGPLKGILTVAGNFIQATGGDLHIEIGGPLPGMQHDVLNVLGHAHLSGALHVALTDGFLPPLGLIFDILNFNSSSGHFTSLDLPTEFYWNTTNLYTTGAIFAEAPVIPGDYNYDRTVNAADYVLWRNTDGTPAGYNTWRAHFGQTAGNGAGAAANAAVPEPTTLVLLIVTAVGIRLRRRDITWRVPLTR